MKKIAICAALLLASCDAVVPATMANMRMQKSQQDYRACLERAKQARADNAAAVSCDIEKTAYEMDLKAVQAVGR